MRLSRAVAVAASALLSVTALAACAQETTTPSPQATGVDACAPENLTLKNPGVLTVGTSKPAFPPYVIDDDPTNGEGLESALAYAVAEQLGFSTDQVQWTFAPFAKLFQPGDKDYDFALNQISISPKRAQQVDFSTPYYSAPQAILALKANGVADATTIADLQGAKIGVQTGTTSLDFVEAVIQPTQDVAVFQDTNAAKQAINNGQIDAFVTDLPTALYITAVQIPKSTVVGQFESQTEADQWGLVVQKGSALTACVNEALAALTESGQLQDITNQWMADYTEAPVIS
ncbi:MAG: ABC transporter substrate-binding protein [Actinomycetota bacterium]|nr:ABC transporter substrate-binding protein [Actinomycetota bacterium]